MTRFLPHPTTRRITAIAGAAVFAGTLALSWSAQTLADQKHGPEFPISIAEARAAFDARFDALDADGDGVISRSEFMDAPAAARHGGWAHHGKRGPGMRLHGRKGGEHTLVADEGGNDERRDAWEAKRAELDAQVFARLDTDGDGQLSEDEFGARELREARREMVQERMFDRLDRDGSGTLSRAELGVWLNRLEAMDADADGTVTREEARAHRQARRGERRGEQD
jgi:Ca2+-binding EF-hand superfamily protein